MSGKPFPCVSCCQPCEALFARNWAARICIPTYSETSGTFSAGQHTDNANYISAINSTFHTISVSWADTSFVIGGTTYDSKICRALLSESYTVHGFGGMGHPDPVTCALTDTTLTFGAIWKRGAIGNASPKPCVPDWFWHVTAIAAGSYRILLWGRNTSDNGSIPLGSILTNGDGYVYPIDNTLGYNFTMKPSLLRCFDTNLLAPFQMDAFRKRKAPTITCLSSDGEFIDSAAWNTNGGTGLLYLINHPTGPVVMPDCL